MPSESSQGITGGTGSTGGGSGIFGIIGSILGSCCISQAMQTVVIPSWDKHLSSVRMAPSYSCPSVLAQLFPMGKA